MDNYNKKYCPNCGSELPQDAVFCGTCGYNFTVHEENTQQPYHGGQQSYNDGQQYNREQTSYNAQQYYGEQPYGSQQNYSEQQPYDNSQQYYGEQPQNYGEYPPQYVGYPQYSKNDGRAVKIIIIIVSIVLALAIIATGVYFLFFFNNGKSADKKNNNNAENNQTVMSQSTPVPSASPSPTPSPAPTATPAVNGQFVLPYSSIREITTSDLIGLSTEQLMIARNEIYARHGRQFKTDWLQTYFNRCSWYSVNPNYNYDNEDSMLTSIELHNVKVIVDYENSQKN